MTSGANGQEPGKVVARAGMPVVVADSPMTQQYLTFSLAGEMFALETPRIKEIIEYGRVTSVPMVPGFIRGVINLRGAVVPVIDLSVRFGKPRTEVNRRTCIVILEIESDDQRQTLGILVDAVSEVLEIDASQIEPPPVFGAKIRTDFIIGMGKIENEFVILLDIAKVLSIEELAQLTSLSEASSEGIR